MVDLVLKFRFLFWIINKINNDKIFIFFFFNSYFYLELKIT